MTMEIIKKQGLIVWLYTLKNINQLKKYGYVHYTSDKMKYAVIYVDESRVEEVIEKLSQLHYVRNVEVSHMDEVDMTFENVFPKVETPSEQQTSEGSSFFDEIAKQIKETSMEE